MEAWPASGTPISDDTGAVPALGNDLAGAGMRIVPFDADSAEATAALWPRTRGSGLSLADRACLALAAAERIPAMTTDRAWARVDVGVEVRVIR